MDYSAVEKLNERLSNAEEENKKIRLFLTKAIATALLVFCVVVFVGSTIYQKHYVGLGYVKAFADAAMVGALADWFAVVALFRHPLGLPIPHTAIIPSNKKRVAESLGEFIKNNFLSTSKIIEKVRHFDLSGRVVSYLSSEEGRQVVAGYLVVGMSKAFGAINNQNVAHFIKEGLSAKLRQANLAQLAAGGLDLITRNDAHQALLDHAIDEIDDLLARDDVLEAIRTRVEEKIKALKYVGLEGVASRKLTEQIVGGVSAYIKEVRQDQNHDLRTGFDNMVKAWSSKLKQDPLMKFKGEQIRDGILSSSEIEGYFSSIWQDLSNWIVLDLGRNDSAIRVKIVSILQGLASRLDEDVELRSLINNKIEEKIPPFVEKYRDSIGDFISSQIMEWDDEYMVKQLELNVGKDLQFIRINGTIVGGMIGLLIYVISNALSGM